MLSEKIREAVESSGVAKKDIADTCEVTTETIRNWEKGKRVPNAIQIKKLSDITNKRLLWFYNLEEPASSPEPTESILELKRDRDAWRAEAEEWKGRCKALEEKKSSINKQKRHQTY